MTLNFRKSVLSVDATLKQAIKSLNESELKIVLVVDRKKNYIGSVTDGDIRRCLIKNHNVNSCIMLAVNKNSKFLIGKNNNQTIINYMVKNKIQRLPILNEKRKPIKIFLIENFIKSNNHDYPFVIMAGGKGKRMMPLTKSLPKPMLKVKKKPIIKHIIDKAKKEGFKNFFISVNYLHEKITNFLQDGKDFNINIQYLKESYPLGTAGALSLLPKKFKYPILITNGDVITDLNYKNLIEFHANKKSDLTVSMGLQELENPFGVINIKGSQMSSFMEKPITRNYINAGIYVISPDLIKYLPKNKRIDMPDFFKILVKKKKRIFVYPIHENWFDIGNKEKLKLINEKKNK